MTVEEMPDDILIGSLQSQLKSAITAQAKYGAVATDEQRLAMVLGYVRAAQDTANELARRQRLPKPQNPPLNLDWAQRYAPAYDNSLGDERLCECGHVYYRHFDSYNDMAPIGCKYCHCTRFRAQ